MKKIIILLTALFALLSFSLFAQNGKTLVLGTSANFPPFEYLSGKDGEQIVGFDVALAYAIAEKAKLTLKIVDMDFDALIPSLNSGKVDLIISGMTITDERKRNVSFSNPYYEAKQVVLVRNNDKSITSKESLGKKKIAVQLGTTGNYIAVDIAGAKNVVEFKTYDVAILDLRNKKADAIILDEQPAKAFLAKNSFIKKVDIDFDAEFYGIAVKKGNNALLKTINDTLAELKKSGDYEKMLEEYIENYVAK